MKIKELIVVGALVVGLFSCVPLKQFSDIKKKSQSVEDSNQLLKEENRDLTVQLNELDGKFSTLEHRYHDLEQRSKKVLAQYADLTQKNERLSKNQEDLEHQIDLLKDGSSEEITSLLKELQQLQNDLQEREDHVKAAEDELKGKEQALKKAQQELAGKQQALMDTQQKLQELQQALNDQKSAVSSLKDKLNTALRGFYNQGLTVHEKNGKVYVSMEEKLLFKTGSYSLGPNGQEALKSLSGVLASNPDIHIMVEGHTDNVPLNGSGQIKDNWDLSAMRATAVVKIILQNSNIEPGRITAAGRSEYVPLDSANTPEARRKNRRTEIILTPDLSEVLKIIQAN